MNLYVVTGVDHIDKTPFCLGVFTKLSEARYEMGDHHGYIEKVKVDIPVRPPRGRVQVKVVDDCEYDTVGVAEFPNKKAYKDCLKAIERLRDSDDGYENGLNDAYEGIEKFGRFIDIECLDEMFI